jgi:hypothetical protein
MKLLQVQAGEEWLSLLDRIAERDGSIRALVVERLVGAEADRCGLQHVRRLSPSKFNPWPKTEGLLPGQAELPFAG